MQQDKVFFFFFFFCICQDLKYFRWEPSPPHICVKLDSQIIQQQKWSIGRDPMQHQIRESNFPVIRFSRVQWLRLAFSKGPDWVGVLPSPEDGNRSGFRNVVFSSFYNTGRWTNFKTPTIISNNCKYPHRWCLHLIVGVGLECSWDPESYAGGSVATGRGQLCRTG
jgi:hypothetical protein